MQEDFHYYATYCAAYIAGYSHKDCLSIAGSAQLVDVCSDTLLRSVKASPKAATTQLQLELMDTRLDFITLQNMTRIWTSFHFLPYDLKAKLPKRRNKMYMDKYRLICKPNGSLLVDTVELAKNRSLQAVGIAMHVLADTWAHSYFAGIPSLVINNTNFQFYEVTSDGEEPIVFIHNPLTPDNIELRKYSSSLSNSTEISVMNLGHGRAGHLPDYSFMHYRYVPAWGDYSIIDKNNPEDYYKAFGQMIHALRYLRGDVESFRTECYEENILDPFNEQIHTILTRRQINACKEWKAFGESLSGCEIPDFNVDSYKEEYIRAAESDREDTFLGRFIYAALNHKSMVTGQIFKSGNFLAGFSRNMKRNKTQ